MGPDFLDSSEAIYRSLIEASDNFVFALDSEGKFIFANAKAIETFGDLIGKPFTLPIPPEYHDVVKKNFKRRMGGEKVEPYQIEVINKKGKRFWVEISGSPLIKDGKVIGAVYFERDITDRKQAEEELLQEKKRLDDITGYVNCGLLLLDDQARVTYANRVAEEWFGPFRRIKGNFCWELFKLKDPEKDCVALEVLRTGKAVRSGTFMKAVAGEDKFFYVVATPVKDNSGKIHQITEVVVDITDRKQTEEALQESEKKYRYLFENSVIGVGIADESGKVLDVNDAMCKLTGYSRDEWFKTNIADTYVNPEDRENLFKIMKKEGMVENFEVQLFNKKKEKYWCSLSLKPIKYGGKDALLATASDITDRKMAEESMKWQLMKFRIEKGNSYLVKETKPNVSKDVYLDLINCGFSGTILSRRRSEDIKEVFGEETEVFWIAEKTGEKIIAPDLEEIESLIEKLPLGNNVVILDRLDYLIVKNGFENTLRFIQRLNELFYLKKWVLLITLDPKTLSKQELGLLENETNPVKPSHSLDLDEDIYEILRYVYKEEKEGRKPAYRDVGLEFGITKQTTRKRIEILKGEGYLIDKKKGRYKILELTEKGKYLF